ncbi:MAG: hypothetical protein Q9201_004342 [Fulgogasparrea decipioides]
MANDSNLLLERLICLSPTEPDEDWWGLGDTWGVKLWDIYPKTQVCGLGDDDTVILDGARGATIRWDEFVPLRTLGQETMLHRILRFAIWAVPACFFFWLIWVIIGSEISISSVGTGFQAAGGVILGHFGIIVLLLPYLLRVIYCLPTNDSQPFFFGIEGNMEIYKLELLIFGSYEGRLTWSLASSPLSRHDLDRTGMSMDFELTSEELMQEQNFFAGIDPVTSDKETEQLVKSTKDSTFGGQKMFTLVDTYTITVTLFKAQRPPIAVIICGAEGGMQRALLCSEDWTTGTLYREAVLSMETRVWDKMDTLARIRLGLGRSR